MVQYNKMRDDLGKGRQTVRTVSCNLALVNGTTIAVLAAPPFPYKVKRITYASSVATDISGVLEVMVLPATSDLDTAPGTTNRLMTAVAAFADKKIHDGALLGGAAGISDQVQPGGSPIVASVVHNAILGTGLVAVVVEYDSVGTTYGAYDGDSDSQGAY